MSTETESVRGAARIRISRVKMKAGGADVRVLRREPERPFILKHIGGWFEGVVECHRPPDAYAAVAFYFDPQTPGRPGFNGTQCTTHDAIPGALLARIAGDYIAMAHTAFLGTQEAVALMGFEPTDWTPDDAA